MIRRFCYNDRMKKRNIFRQRQKPYEYFLPKDADSIRIEALGMGALRALQEYPTMKDRTTLASEARVALATLRDKKPDSYCNDFEALCNIYIPYYIGGFQDAMSRYQHDLARYESDTSYFAQHGSIRAFKAFQERYAEHLVSIKTEMDTTPGYNQLT
jgi:hypothetical protein